MMDSMSWCLHVMSMDRNAPDDVLLFVSSKGHLQSCEPDGLCVAAAGVLV